MKDSVRKFIGEVAFTTFLSFTLISLFMFFTYWLILDPQDGAKMASNYFYGYILGKLFAVLLFSIALGFINRIFRWKKSAALLRLLHFALSFLAFGLFMVGMFSNFFGADKVNTATVIKQLSLYLVAYPVVVGVTALGRRIFLPREEKKFKSILD